MTTEDTMYDVLIVGQGAAAYSAALYAARYQMKPVIFGALFGGETATGGLIENYPGFPEIDGFDLMLKMREQAEKYDVPIVSEDVVSIERDDHHLVATTAQGNRYRGISVILALGRERRKLGLAHEEEWTGRGVSYCSICDAAFHRGNVVAVVGGGDSAIKGSVLLGKYAEQVYIIYRRDRFTRPEAVNLRHMEESPNITPIFNTSVVELKGQDGLTSIVLDGEYNGTNELTVNGLFVEIGADPRVELPIQLGVELNEVNEVKVDQGCHTNVEGVIAAGDLTDASGDLKQTITAAAQGALAATSAYEHVASHGERCDMHAMGYSLA